MDAGPARHVVHCRSFLHIVVPKGPWLPEAQKPGDNLVELWLSMGFHKRLAAIVTHSGSKVLQNVLPQKIDERMAQPSVTGPCDVSHVPQIPEVCALVLAIVNEAQTCKTDSSS